MPPTRLTWQNVAAPDFRDSLLAQQMAVRAFTDAAAGIGDGLKGLHGIRVGQESAAARMQAMGITSQEEWDKALAEGRIGGNPAFMNEEALKYFEGRRAGLIDEQTALDDNTRAWNVDRRADDANTRAWNADTRAGELHPLTKRNLELSIGVNENAYERDSAALPGDLLQIGYGDTEEKYAHEAAVRQAEQQKARDAILFPNQLANDQTQADADALNRPQLLVDTAEENADKNRGYDTKDMERNALNEAQDLLVEFVTPERALEAVNARKGMSAEYRTILTKAIGQFAADNPGIASVSQQALETSARSAFGQKATKLNDDAELQLGYFDFTGSGSRDLDFVVRATNDPDLGGTDALGGIINKLSQNFSGEKGEFESSSGRITDLYKQLRGSYSEKIPDAVIAQAIYDSLEGESLLLGDGVVVVGRNARAQIDRVNPETGDLSDVLERGQAAAKKVQHMQSVQKLTAEAAQLDALFQETLRRGAPDPKLASDRDVKMAEALTIYGQNRVDTKTGDKPVDPVNINKPSPEKVRELAEEYGMTVTTDADKTKPVVGKSSGRGSTRYTPQGPSPEHTPVQGGFEELAEADGMSSRMVRIAREADEAAAALASGDLNQVEESDARAKIEKAKNLLGI